MARLAGLAALNNILVEVHTAIAVRATAAGDTDRLSGLEQDLYRANSMLGAGEEAERVERGKRCGGLQLRLPSQRCSSSLIRTGCQTSFSMGNVVTGDRQGVAITNILDLVIAPSATLEHDDPAS